MGLNVLYFIPEMAVGPHIACMHYLASIQSLSGNNIYFISCNGKISRCVLRDSLRNFPQEYEDKVCNECIGVCNSIKSLNQFNFIDLESSGLFEAKKIINSILLDENGENKIFDENFEIDGIKIGNITRSQFFLINKKNRSDVLSIEDKLYYLDAIVSNMYIYLEVKKIIDKYNINQLNVYGDYGQNLSALSAAKYLGIDFNHIEQRHHCGPNRQLINVRKHFSWDWDLLIRCFKDDYHTGKLNINEEVYREAFLDLEYNFMGKGWYSEQRVDLSLKQNLENYMQSFDKIVGLFTSSIDESECGKFKKESMGKCELTELGFQNQLEWLSHIKNFSQNLPRVLFIIRIHPREGRESRSNGMISSHLSKLECLLENLPNNVYVIWPNDNYSSYDLMQHLDLAICSKSSIASQLSRMGVPVLSGFYPNDGYPESFNSGVFVSKNISEYEQFFNILLVDSFSYSFDLTDLVKNAVILYVYRVFSNVFDLSDVIPERNFPGFYTNKITSKCDEINNYFSGNEDLINIHSIFDKRIDDFDESKTLFNSYLNNVIDMLCKSPHIHHESKILCRLRTLIQ